MELQELLYCQGFGTRRVCVGLVQKGLVRLPIDGVWQTCQDPWREIDVAPDKPFEVQGMSWIYRARAHLMLHKPAGTECSRKPSAWPSIYSLLPAPLRQRPQKSAVDGVQAVGRLDQDTTGLLLLSDDGQFIHRMASPRHHVPKRYQVHTVDALTPYQTDQLMAGVVLDDDPLPVRAAACETLGSHHLALTLTEGKYHQVKRMLAAVGNRVARLHRSAIGGLQLPSDLLPGQWRWLSACDLLQVGYST
ncbi:MAG: pseudouridine synthase [Betaproteobacteria bacterium]|nr:pseudouridine synthase [Betaproteobacteria bacterium]